SYRGKGPATTGKANHIANTRCSGLLSRGRRKRATTWSRGQSLAATDDQLLVGILEEVSGVYVGESSHYGVRVLFRQDGENWRSFPDECRTVDCLASITSQYHCSRARIVLFISVGYIYTLPSLEIGTKAHMDAHQTPRVRYGVDLPVFRRKNDLRADA